MSEVCLWRAVVLQQFIDATCRARNRYERYAQHIARTWLLSNSDGFRLVCELADLPAARVRREAERYAAQGWPARKFNITDPKGVFA